MFASVAHAMGTAGAGQAGGADALMQFVPLIAMLAIFYVPSRNAPSSIKPCWKL